MTPTSSSWRRAHVEYDAAGNTTLAPRPGAGDETNTHTYVYDAWNRLVQVKTSGGGGDFVAEYRYDGLNRRVRKYVRDASSGDWDVEDYYHSAAWQVIEMRKATEVTRSGSPLNEPAAASAVSRQYVWDLRYVDAPVARWYDQNGDGDAADDDEQLHFTNDANMNTTALVNPSGDVVERYEYSAYGQVSVLDPDFSGDADNTSDFDNEILFAGYRHNPETGLYHVRFRDYHPGLGRWLQRDPAGYVDGGNVYEYVMSEPTGWLDPFGLTSTELQDCLQDARAEFFDRFRQSLFQFRQMHDMAFASAQYQLAAELEVMKRSEWAWLAGTWGVGNAIRGVATLRTYQRLRKAQQLLARAQQAARMGAMTGREARGIASAGRAGRLVSRAQRAHNSLDSATALALILNTGAYGLLQDDPLGRVQGMSDIMGEGLGGGYSANALDFAAAIVSIIDQYIDALLNSDAASLEEIGRVGRIFQGRIRRAESDLKDAINECCEKYSGSGG